MQGDKKKRSSKSEKKKKKKEKKERKKAEKKAKKEKKKKNKLDKQDKRGMSGAASLDPFSMPTSSSFEDRLAAIRALAQPTTSSRDTHARDVPSREHQHQQKRGDDIDEKTSESHTRGEDGDKSSGKDGGESASASASGGEGKHQGAGSSEERAEGDAASQDQKTEAASGSEEAAAKPGDSQVAESKPAAPEPEPVRKPVAEHGAAMTLDQWRAMIAARPEISKVAKGLNAGNEETLKAKVRRAVQCSAVQCAVQTCAIIGCS